MLWLMTWFKQDKAEWHRDSLLPFRTRFDSRGERIKGQAMRRFVNGAWEFRQMTQAEWLDEIDRTAW